MIAPISLARLAHKYGGVLIEPDCHLQSLSIDSRSLASGQAFLALKGHQFDGHEYLHSAVEQGACALVTEKVLPKRAPQWIVKNSLRALGHIAVENRHAFDGKLLALTGSNGKTTVKEMLACILGLADEVLATRGNRNNHIGVPLTLLELDAKHQYAVIEMGASSLGEIHHLTAMAKPDVALVNNVGDAHIGGFGSIKNIEIAKGEIFNGLSSTGTGVVNIDSAGAERYMDKLIGRKMLSFSVTNQHADVFASEIRLKDAGSEFLLNTPMANALVHLAVPAQHNVLNALAVCACCLALDIPLAQIVLGLERFAGVQGRLQSHVLSNGVVVIDDSYNASPSSVRAAIDTLTSMPGHSVLVLGTMAELGDQAEKLHAGIGLYALEKGVERLVTVGDLAAQAAQSFGSKAVACDAKNDAIEWLLSELQPLSNTQISNTQSRILVKGSRSAAMEDIVNAIKEQRV